MSKRLETVGGGFRSWTRAGLKSATRAELKDYLEARGSAVYADEKVGELRAAALEDFDGEKGV